MNILTSQTVVIIGGGNVGLSFALLLADKGISSTLLEKANYPTISPDDDLDRAQFDSRNIACHAVRYKFIVVSPLMAKRYGMICKAMPAASMKLTSVKKVVLVKRRSTNTLKE